MNYASILKCDTANGCGFRVSLFVSGCARNCPGCFNRNAHDPNFGMKFDDEAKKKIFAELSKEYCKGLSILGGDPLSKLSNNREATIAFCKEVKAKFPTKDIWLWTGYTYEELKDDVSANGIFEYIDYMVDGPFCEEKKDLSLKFRGSSNQRVLRIHPEVEDVSNT